MALYEHIFIARQDISEQHVETLTQTISALIKENGGTVAKQEYWGLRTMAYRVKKNRKGHYVLLNIIATHAAIAEMERQMGLNEDIIRFMTLRVDVHEDGDSAPLRAKQRDERRAERRGAPSEHTDNAPITQAEV